MMFGLLGLARSAAQIPVPNSYSPDNESYVFWRCSTKSGLGLVKIMPGIRRNAATVGGSGAEFSGESLGSRMKQKKKSVAGIDQDELMDPAMLADADSCFYEFKGIKIHHKICNEEEEMGHSFESQALTQVPDKIKRIGLPVILLHGFGASVFSWDRVMKPLSRITGSKVLAFDRPAFGLTSRVLTGHMVSGSEDTKPLNPYSMAFSVLATLSFINFLAAEKAVLVAHSAGCLVAVNTYFEAPERIAALILVAPAIFAPLISHKVTRENQKSRENQMADGNANAQQNPFIRIGEFLLKLCMHVVWAAMQMLKRLMDTISSLYRNFLCAVLRSAFAVVLVRMIMDKFGIAAVRNAWFNANQVTEHVLHGYKKPLRAKDWDKALLEYTIAMLIDSGSDPKLPLPRRLPAISCPVLIVTGDNDRFVPAWNAERLSQAIPRSCFQVIKNCGHLPHEEKVEEFLSIVENFLTRVFRIPEEQLLQAPS